MLPMIRLVRFDRESTVFLETQGTGKLFTKIIQHINPRTNQRQGDDHEPPRHGPQENPPWRHGDPITTGGTELPPPSRTTTPSFLPRSLWTCLQRSARSLLVVTTRPLALTKPETITPHRHEEHHPDEDDNRIKHRAHRPTENSP